KIKNVTDTNNINNSYIYIKENAMMLENVNVLLFDFTRENLDEHEEAKVNLISGKNVLEDLIQFEDGEFCESPFVQCIQIPTDDPYNQIPDEQMSDILGIEKNNLLYYRIFTRLRQLLGKQMSRKPLYDKGFRDKNGILIVLLAFW